MDNKASKSIIQRIWVFFVTMFCFSVLLVFAYGLILIPKLAIHMVQISRINKYINCYIYSIDKNDTIRTRPLIIEKIYKDYKLIHPFRWTEKSIIKDMDLYLKVKSSYIQKKKIEEEKWEIEEERLAKKFKLDTKTMVSSNSGIDYSNLNK